MAIAHALTDTTADIASMSASQAVTKPTSSGATHRLVLVVCNESGGTPATTSIATSGWTQIGSIQITTASRGIQLYAFHGAGDATAPTLTNSASGASHQQGYVCAAFTGCDTTTPIDATGTANSTSANGTTLTTNLVTVATDQAWHLIAFADWLGGTYSATGFTNTENGHTNAPVALLYNTTPKSTGSTGTVVVTSSASSSGQSMLAIPFALRPAAAASAWTPPGASPGLPPALLAMRHRQPGRDLPTRRWWRTTESGRLVAPDLTIRRAA